MEMIVSDISSQLDGLFNQATACCDGLSKSDFNDLQYRNQLISQSNYIYHSYGKLKASIEVLSNVQLYSLLQNKLEEIKILVVEIKLLV